MCADDTMLTRPQTIARRVSVPGLGLGRGSRSGTPLLASPLATEADSFPFPLQAQLPAVLQEAAHLPAAQCLSLQNDFSHFA